MINPSTHLGDLLVQINKDLKTQTERKLKPYCIGMGQLQILMLFYGMSNQPQSQTDLVKHLGVDKGNVSRSMAKLLDKGYIHLASTDTKVYQLSQKGQDLKFEIMTEFSNLHQLMTINIDEARLKETIETLQLIAANLEVN